ncbi:MAG: T9SS type A sorting domain-containing protein [Saprospiraceae bacterium]|nr:T9SS type A sorting domain-containing protein [Saprospiraceae bacterium]MCB9324989.1 T9SS type A sorting domain-containing protein [Lewinellaceae bacterium]
MTTRITTSLSIFFLFLFLTPHAFSQCDFNEVTITSTTGEYADEMSWQLHDSNGLLITQFQGEQNATTTQEVVCLMDGCYVFTASDSYGDGWNGGSVHLEWENSSENFGLDIGTGQVFYFGINATDCIPEILGCTDPNAFNYDPLATVDDGSCITLEGIVDVQSFDTLLYSGPKDNRINFVIQNRTSANPNDNFTNAQELRSRLELNFLPSFDFNDPGAKMPYAQYKNFFNLYAAWWPDAPGDHTWWSFNIIQQLRNEIFLPWANDETGWVTWFSTSKYGGGGGAGLNREARVGDGKMYGTDYETLLHEFGHTMPGLLDEYTSSGEWSGNQCFETANTTGFTLKDEIPWRKWIDDATPLPTPYNGAYENVIGAFEGGLTNYFGCHRPTAKGCYMGAGGFGEGYGQDLCAPCVQRVICFLYKYVNVIENPQPSNPELTVTGNQTITFSADVVAPEPNTQKYEWFLNGKRIAEGTTSIEVTFGPCADYKLVFAVTDTTDLVRYDEKFDETYPKPYREFVWTIDQSAVNVYNMNATVSAVNADCTGEENGLADFSVTGGLAPYEFWLDGVQVSNPATGLAPGTSDFTIVDANGCSIERKVQLEQDEVLDLKVCSVHDGGWEVSLESVHYDPGELDIQWSTGATGLTLTSVPDGDYSVTATVNGCSVTKSFSLVSAAENMTVSHQYFPSELERNTGTIYVQVEGGTPAYLIKWFDRLTGDRTDDHPDNIIASGTTWGHLPENAFDDNLGTKWLHAVSNDAWVGYEFPEPTTIVHYAITSADDVPERDPKDWRLEGSDDGNTWSVLDTRTNEDFPNRFQRRVFTIGTPLAYKFCRLFVMSSAGENQIQLQELEFIGTDPSGPFDYKPEFDGHFTRTDLAPGDYRYEVADASSACKDAEVGMAAFESFTASGLTVVPDGQCGVRIENPDMEMDYFWLSDETGTALLGMGGSFTPPSEGNYYVTTAPAGTGQWSSNRRGFAVTMPEIPVVQGPEEGIYSIVDPLPDAEYLWYDADNCGTPVQTGTTFEPGMEAGEYYVAARSAVQYPDPVDPATVPGLLLRMDAADLNGDGMIDDPAPGTSSILDWYFPTGNNWAPDNWFAYRSNHQNGLGIADWATLWLQRLQNAQNNYQTVLMAYEENALSWGGTAPMEGLSVNIPRHADASQLFSNNAPATTLNGTTYLNGKVVNPLTTANPMKFCVLGSVFTTPSFADIFYTDTHWEGKVGEMLFYDHALTDEEMKGISAFLRQKWISTAELESPRVHISWPGITALEEEEFVVEKVSIYPNPVGDRLIIESGLDGNFRLKLFNVHGALLEDRIVDTRKEEIDVSGLTAGLYYIEIIESDGKRQVGRFVKM